MKTNKFIGLMILSALATTGCDRETGGELGRDGVLKIYTESMAREGNAKMLVTPGVYDGDEWVQGEQIDLDGTAYPIGYDATDPANPFYHIVVPSTYVVPEHIYAIYPATVAADGNNIEVANNGSAASTVLLKSLAVTFRASGGALDGTHDVYFPMAAHYGSGADSRLLFRHLTGGLQLTLRNASGAELTLGSVKVALTSDDEVVPIVYNGNGLNVGTSWNASGMSLPNGEIGGIEGDHDVSKTSEMHFSLQTNDDGSLHDGVVLADGEEVVFCVPVTVNSLNRIVVAGYTLDGVQHFVKGKSLASKTIERNRMYDIPAIEIN